MEIWRIEIDAAGGPEAMRFVAADLPPPGPGEVTVAQTAIGVNYLDIYMRRGAVPVPLPGPLGLEAAGRVVAVGDGVTALAPGDRVAYAGLLGAYATHRNAPAARLLKLPEAVGEETAAAALLKGMTVAYLMHRTYPVKAGERVLFWAASGGVGRIAGQWGAALGAEMIGVTAGAAACAAIRGLGYAHAIDRGREDVAARVREITGGAGVPVAYDSAGAASYAATLASLAPLGMFVSFGATTGPVPPVPPIDLQSHGSLYFTRPTLVDHTRSRADLEALAGALFERLERGVVDIHVGARWPLAEAAEAHRALESGTTTGSLVLIP